MQDYNEIQDLYEAVVLDNPKRDLTKLRTGFASVVKALIEGYLEGIVESLEGLPEPEEVKQFNRQQIDDLHLTLIDRYFPSLAEVDKSPVYKRHEGTSMGKSPGSMLERDFKLTPIIIDTFKKDMKSKK